MDGHAFICLHLFPYMLPASIFRLPFNAMPLDSPSPRPLCRYSNETPFLPIRKLNLLTGCCCWNYDQPSCKVQDPSRENMSQFPSVSLSYSRVLPHGGSTTTCHPPFRVFAVGVGFARGQCIIETIIFPDSCKVGMKVQGTEEILGPRWE